MVKDPPFDAWDGEDLETIDVAPDDAAEEVAMHITDGDDDPTRWSELTNDDGDGEPDDRPVTYFDDEQPETAAPLVDLEEPPEPDLEELLERQHYAFPAD
jgi:hypothetical protein